MTRPRETVEIVSDWLTIIFGVVALGAFASGTTIGLAFLVKVLF